MCFCSVARNNVFGVVRDYSFPTEYPMGIGCESEWPRNTFTAHPRLWAVGNKATVIEFHKTPFSISSLYILREENGKSVVVHFLSVFGRMKVGRRRSRNLQTCLQVCFTFCRRATVSAPQCVVCPFAGSTGFMFHFFPFLLCRGSGFLYPPLCL